MSFCGQVKKELAEARLPRSCCRHAFAYGLMQGGHAFSLAELSLHTEHRPVAAAYTAVLSALYDGVTFIEQTLPRRNGRYFMVSVPLQQDRETVLASFGHSGEETALRLNRANFDCDVCPSAYLRGLFLSCGAVSDPQTDYHLEFSVPYRLFSLDVLALLREFDLPARHILRKGSNVIYLKDSEQIADVLTLIGAQNGSLSLYQTMMLKNIRNKVNRQTNCESANIDKTAQASAVQLQAVEKIERNGGISRLPPDLRDLAILRKEHPEYSLRELGESLSPPLSRSGVNHRLRRIAEWAEKR